MARFDDLPFELCELIIVDTARSYPVKRKTLLSQLLRLSRAVCSIATPILYETVFVSQWNVRRICARIQDDHDAFRSLTKYLWVLDPVSPAHAKILNAAFAHITGLGGNLYTFRSVDALRPSVLLLDERLIWWQNLKPENHPVLNAVTHLHIQVTGAPGTTSPDISRLPLRVVIIELIDVQPLDAQLEVVRSFLALRTLRRLLVKIKLARQATGDPSEFIDLLVALRDSRLALEHDEFSEERWDSPKLARLLSAPEPNVFDVSAWSTGRPVEHVRRLTSSMLP